MAYVVADRVKETTTTTGTGNITLAGAATGFKTFSSTIGVGNTTTYVITDATGSQWEVGLGTLSGSSTLVRTTVFSNSAGTTSQINFSAGTKNVFVSMSAAPSNGNVALGTSLGFSPNTLQYTTVLGFNASVSSDGATAVGQYSSASNGNATAVGGGASAGGQNSVAVGESSNASGPGAVAIGSTTGASGYQAVAAGDDASASGDYAVVLGQSASTSASYGIAIGGTATAYQDTGGSPTPGIVVGGQSTSWGGITIGKASTAGSSAERAIVIGHGITAAADDATYMNKFRTGVTPSGTSWTLKWDDGTNEVYAEPGAPTAANWYAYQTQPSPASFSVAMPTGMPTSFFGSGGTLYSAGSTLSGTPSPSGGTWSYVGSTSYYNAVYQAFMPQSDPTSYSGTAYGTILVYYAGFETDSGATNVYSVNTGTTLYSTFSSSIYCSGFSVFGATQYGHAIAIINGNQTGFITPASGVTLAEEFYDSAIGYTFAFFDLDSSAVSSVSMGGAIASMIGPTNYETIFWYNY